MEMDIIGSIYDASSSTNNQEQTTVKESTTPSPDDITGMLMHSFNEAEDDGIDWGVSEDEPTNDEPQEDTVEDTEETQEEQEVVEDEPVDEESEFEETEEDSEESFSENDELLGTYESIKDELEGERETLSNIYERFFKELIEPLFRKLEDSNINVAFDTTGLKTLGVIRIELSHRNSDSSAEMEINIFGNTVNGEFLGMENSEGEAIATSLDDVSLDDLVNILIKVLG